MPRPYPPEFRQRAVQLARQGTTPVPKIAKDLGIGDSGLRNWMHQADADENVGGERLSSSEKKELAELRCRNRVLEQEENEILRPAAASVTWVMPSRASRAPTARRRGSRARSQPSARHSLPLG